MYVARINIVRHFLIYIAVLYFEKKNGNYSVVIAKPQIQIIIWLLQSFQNII